MINKPITGLVIARFADAMGISGTQAERLINRADPDFRKAILETYGEVHDRMAVTDSYVADPDLIELDRVTAELDAARAARPARGERSGSGLDIAERDVETLTRIRRAARNYDDNRKKFA
jgi:hypothetical protein